METGKKRKLLQFLFIFLIIAVIIFMVWMLFWIRGISAECVQDPLKFYAERTDHNCDPEISVLKLECVSKIDLVSNDLLIKDPLK